MDGYQFGQIDVLKNSYVKAIYLARENTLIKFETDQGNFYFFTSGDCCSESWINHISGINALLENKINKTDAIFMKSLSSKDEGHSGRDDVDEIYSFKLFTSQGICELEMRNASNGYYGGYLSLLSHDDFLINFNLKDFDENEWKEVKEDF